MKAVTPVRLAHAPRKAGPAVVRGTTAGGGGLWASTLWHRARPAISPLTRRGLRRGARRARHARQHGYYGNQQRCRGHPPCRARHGLYDNLRSRRHPCVQRPERGIPRDDGRRAPVGQETYESGFQSELIKNKSRRSWMSNVEGTRMRSRRGAAVGFIACLLFARTNFHVSFAIAAPTHANEKARCVALAQVRPGCSNRWSNS